MKKEGFTLVELLAVMVILVVLSVIVIPSVYSMIKNSKDDSYEILMDTFETNAELYVERYIEQVEEYLTTNNYYVVTLNDLKADNLLKTPILDPRSDTEILLSKRIIVTKNIDNNFEFCYEDKECSIPYTHYIADEGVNKPLLAPGMTAVKWNGTTWINVDNPDVDTSWYEYSTMSKQWANAKTADGSMWVWIPRYAYSITNGYHTDIAGNINVKFLIDSTNSTSDGTAIDQTPTYQGSAQTNYIVHPAFTFGTDELPGFWVAKFQASSTNPAAANGGGNTTSLNVKSLPGVIKWRAITIGNAFTVSRNMETIDIYGWGTSGSGIDTHLMKNIEWGAAAYLSKSSYGKETSEIWINPSNNYTTGCAGDSVSSAETSGCLRDYTHDNGKKASTTGNIYGVYDMSSISKEFVAAYIGNGSVATYGYNIISANQKYSDRYVSSDPSDYILNYNEAEIKKGDAVYETSSQMGAFGWHKDYCQMPEYTWPWFNRGGSLTIYAGPYNFNVSNGNFDGTTGFRPVLVVGEGL